MTFSFCRPIREDGDVDVDMYNAELAILATTHQNTWFTTPWLFAEYVVLLDSELLPSDLVLPCLSDATCTSSIDLVCSDRLEKGG